MNTPNETPTHDHDATGGKQKRAKVKRPDRTQRAAFWLRTIELRKDTLAREYRRSLRDTAREGISDEEYAAMLGTLEKMARNLGWDESQKHKTPFGPGRGRGFGRGHRHPAMMHGFGPRHDGFGHDGPGHDDGFGNDGDDGHDRHEHRHPGAKRGFRRRQHSHDRGDGTVATDTPQA